HPVRGDRVAPSCRLVWAVRDHLCCFFHASAPAAVSSLSLHVALPIFLAVAARPGRTPTRHGPHAASRRPTAASPQPHAASRRPQDRKSTRLNSSHVKISYAVFCLKKKNTKQAVSSMQMHRL